MAEIMASISFTLGVLTFARNSTQIILKDINNWKQHRFKLVVYLLGSRKVHDELVRWQTLWHMYEDAPRGLPEDYWGWGMHEISVLAKALEDETQKLEVDLKSYFRKEHLDIPQGIDRERPDPPVTELELQLGNYEPRGGSWKKLKHLFMAETYEDTLSRCVAALSILDKRSEFLFRKKHSLLDSQDFKPEITYWKLSHNLAALAKSPEFRNAAAIFHSHVRTSVDAVVDLYLDHSFHPRDRLNSLLTSARDELASAVRAHNESQISVRYFKCVTKACTAEICETTSSAQQVHNIKQLLAEGTQSKVYFLHESGYRTRFKLYANDCVRSSSLRQDIVDKGVRDRYRSQISYELAENVLLFSGTDMLHALCSCGVHSVQDTNWGQKRHSIRLTGVSHTAPAYVSTQPTKRPWCERFSADPFLRLALVLAEVGLGKAILDIESARPSHCEIGSEDFLIKFGSSGSEAGKFDIYTTQELASHIQDKYHDLGIVIQDCFDQAFGARSDFEQTDMTQVCLKMIEPLWKHYEREVVQQSISKARFRENRYRQILEEDRLNSA